MSDAVRSLGIVYEISDLVFNPSLAPTAWDIIGEVYDVVPPNSSVEEIDVTHYGSTGREFIAGFTDFGEMTFSINWIPNNTTDVLLRGLNTSGAVHVHRITFPPDDAMISIPGFVSAFERSAGIDDRLTATITVRCSGAPTFV